jgi:hypothetical protein
VLLVGMEDVTNTNKPGAVLRLSLGANPPGRCSDLDAGMPSQPFSVAAIPTDRVAAATWDLVVLLDSTNNRELWRAPRPGTQDYPMDVFPLQSPDGSWLVAVGYSMLPGMIRDLYAYDARNGTERHHWRLNSTDIPLGLGWVGMTRSSSSASRFFALNPTSSALREIDPFSGAQIGGDISPSRNLRTIYALETSGAPRVAWVGDSLSPSDAVFYWDTGVGISPAFTCTTACEFAHVVPDPTSTDLLALCGTPAQVVRRVVRINTTSGACTTILDGAPFGPAKRLSRLAIQQ